VLDALSAVELGVAEQESASHRARRSDINELRRGRRDARGEASLMDLDGSMIRRNHLKCQYVSGARCLSFTSTSKRAFEGGLVALDPNDGPADMLLQRIHHEGREGLGTVSRQTRRERDKNSLKFDDAAPFF
jgi:hypothetical protein